MIQNQATSITILGPVQSGKTTYFSALWWLLNNPDDSHKYSVKVESLKGDHTHLNDLAETWLSVERIKHTDIQDWQDMILHLRHLVSNEKVSLSIPDLPGEYIEHALKHRNWKPEIAEYLENSHGFMLFVNVNKVKMPVFLEEFLEFTEEDDSSILNEDNEDNTEDIISNGSNSQINGSDGNSIQEELEAWEASIKKVPLDVYLTDLVQQIHYKYPQRVFTVSVILTGWDAIRDIRKQHPDSLEAKYNPTEWLEKKLPLLFNFLHCHNSYFDFKVYGMSANGGEQDRKDDCQRIKSLSPHERVEVTTEQGVSKDISLPLLSFFNKIL